MTIYITRHGETELNRQGVTCGRIDVGLSDTGMRQAGALAEQVSGLPIDLVISSPLKRARQTAELCAKAVGCPLEFDDRLLELHYGSLDGTPWYTEEFDRLRRQFPLRLPEGESIFQLVQRSYNFLDEALAAHRGKTLLLVSHGVTARVMRTYFTQVDNEDFHRFKMENCQLLTFQVE